MLDKSVIPKGDYCYTIEEIDYKDIPTIYTNLCPYYYNRDTAMCDYCEIEGIEQDWVLLEDQCKICGVNTE